MAKKLVSINLDEELLRKIDQLSMKLGVSRSALVSLSMNVAITTYGQLLMAQLETMEEEILKMKSNELQTE